MTVKNDLFSIGPVTVHGYGLMIAIGIIVSVVMATHRAKKKSMSDDVVMNIAIIGVAAGFVGAKLLYVIVEFNNFLKNPLAVLGSEGFVVYGGIIAGVTAVIVYCKIKKIIFLEYFDLTAPSIAIAQGFGRIGCFLAGCCYGKQTESFIGVVFPEGSFAPAGVKLYPTQLISSAGDFLITIILLLYTKKAKHTGDVGAMYLMLYGVGRFLVEFLRSDERGAVGYLSTSQFISIGIMIVAIFMFIKNRKLNPSLKCDCQ